MALHLLCLVGILLRALEVQAHDSLPTVTSRLSLSNFSLQPDFQYAPFQGKWYFLTLAEFIGVTRNRSNVVIQSINFKLNDDNSYNVTIALYSNFTCKKDQQVALPMEDPGVFTFRSAKTGAASQKINMKIMATDYKRFATVLFHMVFKNTNIFSVFIFDPLWKRRLDSFTGRNKNLSPEVTEYCRSVARSLSLPDEFTFNDLKSKHHRE